MAGDPLARRYAVAYEGGTAYASLGLLQYLFGTQNPVWRDVSAQTPSGRKRYKYGTRRRNLGAAGTEVFLDFGPDGVFTVRVSGDVIDFIEKVVSTAGDKVKMAYTRRGTIYAPTPEAI